MLLVEFEFIFFILFPFLHFKEFYCKLVVESINQKDCIYSRTLFLFSSVHFSHQNYRSTHKSCIFFLISSHFEKFWKKNVQLCDCYNFLKTLLFGLSCILFTQNMIVLFLPHAYLKARARRSMQPLFCRLIYTNLNLYMTQLSNIIQFKNF